MYFVDTCELCVLWWGRMGETVKKLAPLEVPEPQDPGFWGQGDPTIGSSQSVFAVGTPGWGGVGRVVSVFLKGQ